MIETRLITVPQFVEEVASRVQSQPEPELYDDFRLTPVPTSQAPYALVVGAGFSAGSMPMISQLLTTAIGDDFYPDQDMSSLERPNEVQLENSSTFWLALNEGANRAGVSPVELDQHDLPENPGAAFMRLFSPDGLAAMDEMIARPARQAPVTYLQRLEAARASRGDPANCEPGAKQTISYGFPAASL